MSRTLHYFQTPGMRSAVALPFDLPRWITGWSELRKAMIKRPLENFTREEWAYLIGFLAEDNLWRPFSEAFGRPAQEGTVNRLFRPRGPVAIWLPNNVSLLGPLTLILMTLTGNDLHLKTGSSSADLASPFLDFVRRHATGELKNYLQSRVTVYQFDRDDPRNAGLAAAARVRIVFGSDAAAAGVESLPHPVESVGFPFIDRRSQAWIEPKAAGEAVLLDLLKVFAVYGQAGCTSPSKVVLLGGTDRQAVQLRDQLLALWPQVVRHNPPLHQASHTLLLHQWAHMVGWNAALAPRNAALFAVGQIKHPDFEPGMVLPIIPATKKEAVAQLPPMIQTLGVALSNPEEPAWLELLQSTRVKRWVPIAQMHHFQAVWDGQAFWRNAFEEVEVGQGKRSSIASGIRGPH